MNHRHSLQSSMVELKREKSNKIHKFSIRFDDFNREQLNRCLYNLCELIMSLDT